MRIEKVLFAVLAMSLAIGGGYRADGGSDIPPPMVADGGSDIPPPMVADGGSDIPPPAQDGGSDIPPPSFS